MSLCSVSQRQSPSASQEFEALFQQHRQRIHNLAYRMLHDRSDAEDVTQEAFARAWAHYDRYDATRSFEAWMFRIASNICVDQCRRKRYKQECSLDAPAAEGRLQIMEGEHFEDWTYDPVRCLLANTVSEEILNALHSLPEAYRATLFLLEEECSYAEIGALLDCPVGTVRSRIFRARIRMRQELETIQKPIQK